MIITRLTTVNEIVKYWKFIQSGLRVIEEKNKEPFDDTVMFKTCNFLVVRPDVGFISVALDDTSEKPVCFAVLRDATPLFSHNRRFETLAVYHNTKHPTATLELMQHFENWARTQGINDYTISTKRPSGAAIRCFERKYGFKRGFITFEKKI